MTLTSGNHRVDSISNETTNVSPNTNRNRLTSGSGDYPTTGYGSAYSSTQSLVGLYTTEMQLKQGIYQYPSGNYTAYVSTFGAGPNYTGITGYRWATFNLGSGTNFTQFNLVFNTPTGISTSVNTTNLKVQIKVDGSTPTSWVDGNASYVFPTLPGSGPNGVAAVDFSNSTATNRRITFGAAQYTGTIIVRIGIAASGTGISFTSISATGII
jgi:hypothetical protein